MPRDVIMPALGMAQETGKVIRWLKAEGDAVAAGEPLLEVETDKVTVELESPATGTLAGIRAAEGDEVPVGEAIAVVLAEGEELAEAPTATRASPKARRLAAERGVELSLVAGTGSGGAVVAADLGAPPALPSVWRLMAARTTESWQSVPHFYVRREVEASQLERRRTGGATYTDVLVKLVAEALQRHPNVNATWRDGAPVRSEHVNVGIAVAVDDGLVVPVVHDADRLSLAEVSARREQLVEAARAGKLRMEDVVDGTFTVSNLGMYGVDSFDAIVNAPQAGILAVGRIAERVVPVGGQSEVRPMMQLSLSFDHRVVDGARGAEFLQTLAALIEDDQG